MCMIALFPSVLCAGGGISPHADLHCSFDLLFSSLHGYTGDCTSRVRPPDMKRNIITKLRHARSVIRLGLSDQLFTFTGRLRSPSLHPGSDFTQNGLL